MLVRKLIKNLNKVLNKYYGFRPLETECETDITYNVLFEFYLNIYFYLSTDAVFDQSLVCKIKY